MIWVLAFLGGSAWNIGLWLTFKWWQTDFANCLIDKPKASCFTGCSIFWLHPPPPLSPAKDDWNPNPQILVSTLWKMNLKGSFFVSTFEKFFRRVKILSSFLMKKSKPPFKNLSSLGGVQITNGTSPLPGIIEAPVKNK